MPRCALPEHINDKEEIENAFPDDSQYKGFFGNLIRKWNKATKHIDAWGWRCPPGFAFTYWPPFILWKKWRVTPVVLLAFRGKGWWRVEKDGDGDNFVHNLKDIPKGWYLTRVQLWCRWHVQLQWPLFFCVHWYKDAKDVIPAGEKADRDGRLYLFYIGAKRDGDCYWYLSCFPGENWK